MFRPVQRYQMTLYYRNRKLDSLLLVRNSIAGVVPNRYEWWMRKK
jgi:hypothetical protein